MAKKRTPLTRERVLTAAVGLADRDGIESLSMRTLGQALGVEAMSLYNHVANKDAILDGIVDLVVAEIEVPTAITDWRAAMRARCVSTHKALLRHPWAIVLIESRTQLGPARLRYFNAVLGILRRGGFSIARAYNAFLTLDSYIYGFTLQEVSWPFESDERSQAVDALIPQLSADEYPYMLEIMQHAMHRAEGASSKQAASEGYTAEFELGLDLVIDGLERLRLADCDQTD